MAAPKIKKKSTAAKTSAMPRQGAAPCLILIGLLLLIVGLIFFFALRSTT
ncbi:MAG: hypothetical protein JO340_21105 [Acidobacteriaceae bacterium]|nr:hypothetical protein [Acidobacteriaceae bacterium]